jgi:ABC-2 type transport system permease protein
MTVAPVTAKQPSLGHVLIPKWRTMLTRMRQERDEGGRGKAIVLGTVGLIFWVAVFGVLFRVLRYFRGVEEIGALLAGKLLGLVLLSFVSVLLLSNVITALSSFFLAKDLDLLVSSPVDWLRIYLAKLLETLINSSWMVALMAVPIFTAYGISYHGGLLFPFIALATMVPFLVMPAVIGSAVTTILVNVFPARRTRDLLSIIALGAAAGVILLFRIVRPERLARPEGFQNLLDFIAVLKTPTSPLLPSEWVTKAVMGHLTGRPDWLALYLLWTTAALLVAGGAWLHARAYHTGFTKAQEGAERFVRGGFWDFTLGGLLKPLGPSRREFVLKDLRLFFRDTTQWSQLILLAALLVVYLFNIKSLPLFRGEQVPFFLVSVVSFLNLGLAGFVLASIAARFIFPAVSLEGRQMWLLRSSPLEMRAMLWAKYWVGTIPLLVLALAITILTNVLLKATPFMMAVGVGTILLLTFAISAMALAFGALYPQFETENAAQIPTSFGGLVFMMATIALLAIVIVIESIPVYRYLRSAFDHQPLTVTPLMVGSFALAGAVCIAATVIPLRIALKRIEEYEF